MSYFEHHVFVCTNQRDNGEPCCNEKGASEMWAYLKARVKDLGISGQGRVRINKAGCLDRCKEGPILVIYPEETWYTFIDKEDIDEIIDEHLVAGRVVERLRV